MKKFIFVFVLLLISVRFYAQAPEKVNYQAVARNLAGAPLINQTINVKYEIRQGSTTGVVVYAENHVLTTNQFGLFTAEIGGGTVITGSFPGIAWGTSPFYLFVEVDGDPMGVTQLLSVPYALYAKESGNGPAGLPGKNSLSVSSAYSGPMCSANGGSQIDVGLDDNNDGILQPIEIDFTYYVCNGTDGVIGSNGLNTLSSTVASTSCTNGGVTVNMGLDANNNNILEASEISVSYDVCNGVDGIAGTNGTDGLNLLAETIPSTSCPNGGVTVNMGQDINNNGILETGEITTTYDVCNGVDGTSGTTYFAGNGISLSGDTITNIGDADADPTNELQNLSISNDTLYISGGNQVIIPGLTETTTTLIDNGNGTFTYTDETGTPITFDANIDDADADASNELQVLSISNDTIFLSNGGFVQLPPAVGDNWGSQTVNVDGTTITGDGVVTPLSGFDGQYSSLTGTPIDNDTSATNELQVLTISNDTIFLSNGGFVQLPAAVGDNWGSQTVNVDGTTITGDGVVTPLSGFDGQYSSLTGTPIDNDTSATNEIQVLSISNDTIFLSNGGFVQLPAAAGDNWGSQTVNVDGTTITGDGVVTPLSGFDGQYSSLTGTPIDNDTSATNELQVLSFSNDTLYLSNGNSVYIMPDAGDNWGSQTVNVDGTTITGDGVVTPLSGFDGQYSSLTGAPTNVSTFTNDAGYITNPDDADADASNELQVLSFSNDTLYLSNGNSVYITPGAGDNWGSQTVNVDGTTITGDGVVTPLSGFDGQYSSLTGTPIDNDTSATNELQVLSISNDTLFLTNGGFVQLPAAAGDNWGSQTVNVDGTTITGDGVVTPLSGFDGQYSSLTGAPTNVSTFTNDAGYITNPDDADADASNELQVLSFSNDTLYLSNGNSVYITPGAGDNWGSQTVNVDGTTITGDGVVTPLSGFDGQYSSLMGAPTNVSTFTNDAGYITNPDDADADATNEIQTLSFASPNLTLSNGGGTVNLSGLAGPTYTPGAGINIAGNVISAKDTSDTNELQNLSSVNSPGTVSLSITNGTGTTFSIDDADANPTNELITSFGLNGTSDSLVIVEGGNTWSVPKSSLIPNGKWTQVGDSLFPTTLTNSVGIGTVSPQTKLHIVDNVGLRTEALLESTAGNFKIGFRYKTPLAEWSMGQGEATGQQFRISDVYSGTTPFVINQSSGNVGIGTTNPSSAKLELQHAATAAYPSVKLNQTNLNLNRIHFTNTPVANKYWEIAAETDANNANSGYSINYFNGSTYNIHFLTYGNGKTAINGSGFVPGPNYSMFDVFGSSTIRDSLSIRTSHGSGYTFPVVDGSANYIMKTDGAGNLSWMDPSSLGGNAWSLTGNAGTNSSTNFIGTTDAQDLKFRTNNTEKMVITQSGDVGIGTTSPGSLLHLEKNNTPIIYVKENTPTNGAAVILESANQYMLISNESGIFRVQNNTTSETPFNIASDGSIGLGGDAQHSELDVFGQITMRTGAVNGYIPVSDVNGTMTWTDPSTLSSGWGLTGNAGTNAGTNFIGTTDAQNLTFKTNNVDRLRISQKGQLEIFNTGLSVFIGEAAGANDDLTNNSNTFIGYYSGTSNTTGSGNNALGYQSLQSNSTGIYNTALGNQALNTNISGSHNIAIGFNTLRDHNTGDRNVAIGNQAGLSNTAGVGNIFLGDNAGRNEIGSNKLYIANSNTASPLIYGDFSTNLLRVNGSLNINNAYTLPTTDGAANYIMQTNGTGIVSWVDPFSLGGPWTKSGNDIYPTNFATENVAIGTNTPGAKLHVQDNLATNAPLFRIKNENLSFPSTMAFTSGNDTYNYIMGVDPADNSFKISNSLVNLNASTRFTIASSGNVGIGTTAPNSKLNVNGDVGLNDGATVATNNAITILLTNSGPAVAAGDIVVVGTFNNSFNVTNNPGHYAVIGVAAEAISGGSVGKIAISGVATVNIESASNVIRGQHCITGNSNGRASGISIPSAGTSIGVYLTDGPADGTAKVLLR